MFSIKFWLCLTIAVLFTSVSLFAKDNSILKHDIQIEIMPDKSLISGKDIITYQSIANSIELSLLKDLKIKHIKSANGNAIEFNTSIDKDSIYQIIKIQNSNSKSIEISFSGKVYYPADERNLKVRHSNSPGIISAKQGEGIYLPPGAFYPFSPNDISDYVVKITYPNSMQVLTSGVWTEMIESNNRKSRTFTTELPSDNLTVVGANYFVYEKKYKNIDFAVYLINDNKSADAYLAAMTNYFDLYSEKLGKYPYSNFTIVENFFATGFGMPNYTLISGLLMQMPWVFLSPGSLAHEFVHNWWGNSVYVQSGSPNWCEALTTFCTNYYFNHLNSKPSELLDWRKKALIALQTLPAQSNYPVIDFRYQRNQDDAVIGYSKGAFIFLEIYKLIGDKPFFDALTSFSSKFAGSFATWDDLKDEFLAASNNSIDKTTFEKAFSQWLNSTVVPDLMLSNVSFNNNQLQFDINQESDLFSQVPVRITTKSDTSTRLLTINKASNHFVIDAVTDPIKLEIDPEYFSLRQLNYFEIPFTLGSTLNSNPLLILPKKDFAGYNTCLKFKDMLLESGYDVELIDPDNLANSNWTNRPLIVLGAHSNNPFLSNFDGKYPDDLEFANNSLIAAGKEYSLDGNIMTINMTHPANSKLPATIIGFDAIESEEQFRRLFHYMSYSMLLLSKSTRGKPIYSREIFPAVPVKNNISWKF